MFNLQVKGHFIRDYLNKSGGEMGDVIIQLFRRIVFQDLLKWSNTFETVWVYKLKLKFIVDMQSPEILQSEWNQHLHWTTTKRRWCIANVMHLKVTCIEDNILFGADCFLMIRRWTVFWSFLRCYKMLTLWSFSWH